MLSSSHHKESLKTLQHKLLSPMSSHDSDTEIDLQTAMPLLPVHYSPQPKSAGDILAHGISAATIEHSNDLSPVELTPENICNKNIQSGDNRKDVVDSAPSREGRILDKENVYDNDCKNSQISNSENNSECSQLSEVNENPKNVTCYSTVCILISCKNICTRFSIVDLVLILGSIGLYIFDTATDILNGLSYYNKREENKDNLFYFILTMVVIVLPSFIMQAFSIWWEWEDDSKRNEKRKENGKMVKNTCCKHFFLCIVHVLQVGPIYRYIRAIHHGVKSRRRELQGNKKRFDFYNKMWKYQLSDVSFLRVMESYLESAPQVVLQIYIMIKTMQTPFITVLSCCVSIIGMSSMLVSWQRNLRDTLPKELNKKQISICGTIMLFLYRTCTITARVFALALLLIVNIWAWLGFFVGHWMLCFIWIKCQKTKFCNTTFQEVVYNIVIGFCYTFAYINVLQNNSNRSRLIIYYSIVFMENLILSIVWYCHRTGGGCLFEPLFSTPDFFAVSVTTETVPTPTTIPNSIAIGLMIGINFLFFMGMVFMLMYYTFFHPSKNIPCWDCSHENAGHLNTAEATGLTGSTVATRNNHNIRQKRQGSQFRSWHSASLTYEENQEINKTLKKRPSSDILPESMNVFTENKLPDDTMKVSSIMESNSAACSCYSLRTTALGCQSVKSTPSRSNAALASAVVHQPTSRQHLDEAERKRRYFRQLIEQKKELEHQQAMLKINMEQQISSYSLRKQKISDYEPYKQIKDSYSGDFDKNLKMYVPQSGDKPVRSHSRRTRLHSLEESPKHTYSPSFSHGTFPRYTRTHLTYNPQQKPAVPHTTLRTANYLKPISENKSVASSAPGLRDYSASLSNLTMPFPKPKQKVPRAMSFTVRKDEVIESMESSV